MRHCCTQRLRFRGLIPLPVEVTVTDFSASDTLALLSFASLGRSPSLPSGLTADYAILADTRKRPADRPKALRH